MRDGEGRLPKIPAVGPSSLRVVTETLETGGSPTVERAIDASGRRADIERRRALRDHFLSRAAVLRVLRNRRLQGPRPADYRGDLQMHSVYSDGSQTLAEIIAGGIARGYEYSAVTDHSHGLPIARGMSLEAVGRQHAEIDALNAGAGGRFRLLKGIEANILADGGLDLEPADVLRFEIVVAAPHSKLRVADDQTARLVAAASRRGVHVLGHPRGRMYGSRAGVRADWDRVFETAARSRVAIEIDGDPARQDLDFTLAARAKDAGCLIALDSDAHSTPELAYADTALAHARLAGIPAAQVINTWPLEHLLAWAVERQRA